MTLSERARSVWAKFGYDPESRHWLPLWLHLLDAAAVAEYLARHWLAPTIRGLIEREFAGSDSGLTPLEEFCQLTSWIAGVHDIGKCTPAFSVQVPGLDDRMKEAGLIHEPVDPLERRKVPHALAGHLILESWLMNEHGWGCGPAEALASVVGAHHGIPPTTAALGQDYYGHEHLLGEGKAWSATRQELLELVTRPTGTAALLPHWARHRWTQPFLVELSGLLIVSDWIASTEAYFPLLPLEDDGACLLAPEAHAPRVATGLSRLEIPAPWRPRDEGTAPDQPFQPARRCPRHRRPGARAPGRPHHGAAGHAHRPGVHGRREDRGGPHGGRGARRPHSPLRDPFRPADSGDDGRHVLPRARLAGEH